MMPLLSSRPTLCSFSTLLLHSVHHLQHLLSLPTLPIIPAKREGCAVSSRHLWVRVAVSSLESPFSLRQYPHPPHDSFEAEAQPLRGPPGRHVQLIRRPLHAAQA